MKIDPQARANLANYLTQKTNTQQTDTRMQQIIQGFLMAQGLLAQINDSLNSKTPEQLTPLLQQLVALNAAILAGIEAFTITLPTVYPIEGAVEVKNAIEVKNLPDIKSYLDSVSQQITGMQLNVKNLKELKPYFDSLNNNIGEVQTEIITLLDAVKNMPQPQAVVIPDTFNINKFDDLLSSFVDLKSALSAMSLQKPVTIPKSFSVDKFDELLEGVEELKKGFNLLINKEVGTVGFPDKDIPVIVTNFKYPAPVTHISLNSLKGPVLSTAVNVGTTATPLPGSPLQYRRAVVVFNNGANTIYLGGANVTTSNGMPVPAATYAPALDSGVGSIIYGIVASGTVEARVLESSDYAMGF